MLIKLIVQPIQTFANTERHSDDTVSAGSSIEAAHEIGEVVEDGQVVLDDNDELVRCEEISDRNGRLQPLFYIQVARRFVEHETETTDCENSHKITTG